MLDEQPLTPVGRALAEQGIPFREFRHPGPIFSLEQAAEERGQRPEQVVRSILFRLAQGDYLMVLVAGPRQIDWKALRRYVGQSRLTMASADEVRQVTSYEIGAVSPFALPQPIRILLDEGVLREDEVSIGSGVRNITVILSTADLLRALGDVERVSVVPA
ncbi:MAG: YbaK/EbsC family protein [Candidatus Promineofilum sp.]|nr:YbaK/EbsC family protein [Promineifilum sp.]